jgi:hypothetical protein
LERLAELVRAQSKLRVAGQPISDRLVSISDPDARPTRKGKLRTPTELCENTRRGARGLILPASTGISSLDGGFTPGPVRAHLPEPDRLFISGHHAPHARKTNRRLAKFRVGAQGRISHLKPPPSRPFSCHPLIRGKQIRRGVRSGSHCSESARLGGDAQTVLPRNGLCIAPLCVKPVTVALPARRANEGSRAPVPGPRRDRPGRKRRCRPL